LQRLFHLVLVLTILVAGNAQARMEAGFGLCQVRPPTAEGGNSPAQIVAQMTSSMALNKREKGSHAWFFSQRANAYAAMKQFDCAIEDFSEALSEVAQGATPLVEHRLDLLLGRGRAYGETGDYVHALEDFDAALTLRPSSAGALLDRGVALRLLGQYDRAIADFDRLILLDQGPFLVGRAFVHRGAAYTDKGDYERARHDFDIARYLDVVCAGPPMNNLCWIGALQGKPRDEASGSAFTSALDRFWSGNLPESLYYCRPSASGPAAAFDSRAFVYLQLGELAEAQADADAAVRLAPGDGEVRYTLAMILEAQGDRDNAKRQFAEAERLAKPGEWARWNRQQGKFRGLEVPASPERQADEAIRQSMAELTRLYAENPDALRQPGPQVPPLRVAALLFEDKAGEAERRCHTESAGALATTVADFNRAVGRRLFVMSDVDHHDVLFVIGGPKSAEGVDVDGRSAEILAAEQRQTALPHRKEFLSYAPPHLVPSDWLNLYYRRDTTALLYGVVGRSWKSLGKSCSAGFAADLEGLLTWGPYRFVNEVVRKSNQPSNLRDSFVHGRGAIETCFLAGRTGTEAESLDCVKQLAALIAAGSD